MSNHPHPGFHTQKRVDQDSYAQTKTSFDVRDARGRVIGALIETTVAEFWVDPDRPNLGWNRRPGIWLGVRVQSTRNGIAYGAYQQPAYFETEAECQAYIAKRIADSRKAAQKKGGRP